MAWAGGRASRCLLNLMGFRLKGFEEYVVVCAPGFLPRECLPTSDRDVDKEGVDFNAKAIPAAGLCRDQRGAAAKEWFVDRLPRAGVVQHGPAHALDRL